MIPNIECCRRSVDHELNHQYPNRVAPAPRIPGQLDFCSHCPPPRPSLCFPATCSLPSTSSCDDAVDALALFAAMASRRHRRSQGMYVYRKRVRDKSVCQWFNDSAMTPEIPRTEYFVGSHTKRLIASHVLSLQRLFPWDAVAHARLILQGKHPNSWLCARG